MICTIDVSKASNRGDFCSFIFAPVENIICIAYNYHDDKMNVRSYFDGNHYESMIPIEYIQEIA